MAKFGEISAIAKRNVGRDFEVGEPKSIEQGVSSTVRAAVDPELEKESGAFLEDTNVKEVLDYARDETAVEELWRISEEIIGGKFEV